MAITFTTSGRKFLVTAGLLSLLAMVGLRNRRREEGLMPKMNLAFRGGLPFALFTSVVLGVVTKQRSRPPHGGLYTTSAASCSPGSTSGAVLATTSAAGHRAYLFLPNVIAIVVSPEPVPTITCSARPESSLATTIPPSLVTWVSSTDIPISLHFSA